MAAKPKKQKTVPELKVVLDTNAIFTKHEHYLLTKDVAELIQNSTQHADLKVTWYLPNIVRHERQFQMTKRALELLQSIQKVEKLLGHNLNITEAILKERVQAAIDNQITELSINIIENDVTNIDWNRVILDAAYRKPPFSPTDKEKGFRDALIAEAFVQLVASSPTTPRVCRVALVTGDELLTEAVKTRIAEYRNVRILSTIEELKGLINTLVSEVSEEFVHTIKETASNYFFSTGDENSLWNRENIYQKISQQFNNELSKVPTNADEREISNILIGPPQFKKKEGQRVFWVSSITVAAKAYKYDSPILKEEKFAMANPIYTGPQNLTPFGTLIQPSRQLFFPNTQNYFTSNPFASQQILPLTEFFPNKSLLLTGEFTFNVTWSVVVTARRHSFSSARIENIEYVGASWETVSP